MAAGAPSASRRQPIAQASTPALGYWVHPGFLLFTGFVGLNLSQSAFTNACPAMAILRGMGLRACASEDAAPARG